MEPLATGEGRQRRRRGRGLGQLAHPTRVGPKRVANGHAPAAHPSGSEQPNHVPCIACGVRGRHE